MKEYLKELYLALMGRRHQYQLTFRSPPGQIVLADMARFCRANDSTFHPDARVQAMLEGRREVWLRIQDHLHLPPDELFTLYSKLPKGG